MSDPVVVILASSSPRRRELLEQLGVELLVVAPDVDESVLPGEAATDYVRRLALAKAAAVAGPPGVLVIAADTTVVLDGEILLKPDDAEHAATMLRALSGRTHRVLTGIAVARDATTLVAVDTSLVTFTPIDEAMIQWYVATGEPLDKAGAYAVQGAGAVFVQRVRGSVSNVVGLPLHTVHRLAAELGVALTRTPVSP